MEKDPEGSRAERRGWPWTEGDKKQGVRRRPSSLGGGRERKSHIEVEVLHIWGLNPCEYGEIGARLSEKREHVLMHCGLQNSQRGKMDLARDHRYIKKKPTHVYNQVYTVSVELLYIWR